MFPYSPERRVLLLSAASWLFTNGLNGLRSPDKIWVDQETLDYFFEIALTAEYNDPTPGHVQKWVKHPTYTVHGEPTPEDLYTLSISINELNGLITPLKLQQASMFEDKGSVRIHFVPKERMSSILSIYVEGALGFFGTYANDRFELEGADILLATDNHQWSRDHLIREEVTQMLGLMNDSPKHRGSIFYENGGDHPAVTSYTELDKRIIRLLYHPFIKPGMTKEDLLKITTQEPFQRLFLPTVYH